MSHNDSSFIKPSACALGTCTLVGAGDPELLTLKAVKAIQAASVLFVDDLVNDAVLNHASPTARIVHVGKRGGCISTPQAFIENASLPEQRQALTRLDRLTFTLNETGLKSPSILVVGNVVQACAQIFRTEPSSPTLPLHANM